MFLFEFPLYFLISSFSFFEQTNNAQEGFNLAIKRDFTMRERLPSNEFKIECLNIASTISSRYDEEKMKLEGRTVKKIIDLPTISNAQYREAHEWTSNENMVIAEIENNAICRRFLTPTPKFNAASPSELIEMHKKKFDTFESYKQNGHKMIYETKICLNNFLSNSTCTCGDFTEKFICKHIIGFILQLKLKTCPKEGISKPICSRKKKPGRPKQANDALKRQQQ